jgi:hypothetical protein
MTLTPILLHLALLHSRIASRVCLARGEGALEMLTSRSTSARHRSLGTRRLRFPRFDLVVRERALVSSSVTDQCCREGHRKGDTPVGERRHRWSQVGGIGCLEDVRSLAKKRDRKGPARGCKVSKQTRAGLHTHRDIVNRSDLESRKSPLTNCHLLIPFASLVHREMRSRSRTIIDNSQTVDPSYRGVLSIRIPAACWSPVVDN